MFQLLDCLPTSRNLIVAQPIFNELYNSIFAQLHKFSSLLGGSLTSRGRNNPASLLPWTFAENRAFHRRDLAAQADPAPDLGELNPAGTQQPQRFRAARHGHARRSPGEIYLTISSFRR